MREEGSKKRPRRETQARIIGGSLVPQNSLAWIGSMQDSFALGNDHFCGASLIAPRFALSAGHCLESIYIPERLVFNTTNLEDDDGNAVIARVKATHFPPNYTYPPVGSGRSDVRDDLVVLELEDEVTDVEPVRLNWNNSISRLESSGRLLYVAGWGATFEEDAGTSFVNELRETTVPVVELSACNETYSGRVFDTNVCAGNATLLRNTCVGDSGGPLYGTDSSGILRQVGITSWGGNCNQLGSVGIYTSISKLSRWISNVTDLQPDVVQTTAPTLTPTTWPSVHTLAPSHQPIESTDLQNFTLAPSFAPTTHGTAGSGAKESGTMPSVSHTTIVIASIVSVVVGLILILAVSRRYRRRKQRADATMEEAKSPPDSFRGHSSDSDSSGSEPRKQTMSAV